MGNKAAAVAAPAKADSETVIEYVLTHHRGPEDTQPLLSDHELEVIQHEKMQQIRLAREGGRGRPDLRITKRKCTYPLSADGKRMALGSTCVETEV